MPITDAEQSRQRIELERLAVEIMWCGCALRYSPPARNNRHNERGRMERHMYAGALRRLRSLGYVIPRHGPIKGENTYIDRPRALASLADCDSALRAAKKIITARAS